MADAYRGFYDITHNSLALLGTVLAVAVVVLGFRADLRASAEEQLLGWLLQRQEAAATEQLVEAEPTAVDRVTAADLSALPEQQAKVTQWLSRKYRVAPEPLAALVTEAYAVGEKARLDPTLILAVMAVESRFNPFAQSPVGAQGLMQVLTRVHTDKYEDFGGQLAAFDPVSNLRVGAQVLQDAIRRAGSVEGGLRLYVGAVTTDGGWYIDRVLAEHARIQSVALGRPVPRMAPAAQPIPVKQQEGQPARPVPAADIEAVVPPGSPSPAAVIPS
nr:transglycosylase SLT domain-containing protein [Hydrogenophaga sp. IBVHS2]